MPRPPWARHRRDRRQDECRFGSGVTDEAQDTARGLRNRAIGLLSRREHSRRELVRKLARVTSDATLVEHAIDRLAEQGLQSDERFAAALVRRRTSSGHGPLRLLGELREHGIDSPTIETALAEAAGDWHRVAAAARAKRFGEAPPASRHELARQLRFLQYRGFTSEQARRAVANDGSGG